MLRTTSHGVSLIIQSANSYFVSSNMYYKSVIISVLVFNVCITFCGICGNLTAHPGHMKPFGHGGPFVKAPEVTEFPSSREFFETYVAMGTPLVVRGGAKRMAAFSKWTDEYLGEITDSVMVEMSNDDRSDPVKGKMRLAEYITKYNGSDMYLISPVPETLKGDVTVPCPLQCNKVTQELMAEDVLWLSARETRSAVHTDPAENINCILRGEKTFILVDSPKHRHKMDMFSDTFNVDAVDYAEFDWMADLEFYNINVSAGDCLYLPYMWHHQVRSFGNTMAVNVWWKHYNGDGIDEQDCSNPCDVQITLTDCKYTGIVHLEQQPEEMRDFLLSMFDGRQHKTLDTTEFATLLNYGPLAESFSQLLALVDNDGDGYISEDDIKQIPKENLQEVSDFLHSRSGKYSTHDEF